MSKVSVIIPVYNVEKYLRQCLDSVVNQTLEDIEIICVNDCSPDNSLDILKEYAQKDSRIRIIDLKENGGPGNARNIGIDSADGKYIMFLDPDDWYELDACELAYNQITKNENDFVIFGFYKDNEIKKKRYIDKKSIEQFTDIIGNKNAGIKDLKVPFLFSSQCWYKIYNSEFIKKHSINFHYCNFEDGIFNVKCFLYSNSFSVLNEPLYHYRIRYDSITMNKNSWKDLIYTRRQIFNYLKENKSPQQKRFLEVYSLAVIRALKIYYKKFSKGNIKLKFILYRDVYDMYTEINNELGNISIDEYIKNSDLYLIIKHRNYLLFCIEKYILNTFFSVKNQKMHKIITILGIKIKIKRKKKDE